MAYSEDIQVGIIEDESLIDGDLRTATFQRTDGKTSVWLWVEGGSLVEAIYNGDSGFCRVKPPANPQAVFGFSRVSGRRLQFGGVDFGITIYTNNQLSGS